MSIRELYREFAAARLRAQDDYRRDVTLAWNVVRIYFTAKGKKKLMPLQSLIDEVSETRERRQSVVQLRSMLGVLSEQYGLPIKKGQIH